MLESSLMGSFSRGTVLSSGKKRGGSEKLETRSEKPYKRSGRPPPALARSGVHSDTDGAMQSVSPPFQTSQVYQHTYG